MREDRKKIELTLETHKLNAKDTPDTLHTIQESKSVAGIERHLRSLNILYGWAGRMDVYLGAL